jgi:hypothetical protein
MPALLPSVPALAGAGAGGATVTTGGAKQSSTYIDILLKKYQKAPSFPFDDWTTYSVSFYALMSLWDEVFRTAAGKLADFYVANGDAKMEEFSFILDIGTRNKTRRVTIQPETTGGVFFIATKPATEHYAPDLLHLGERPDRSELGFAADLDRNRLIAACDMIRIYTHTDLPDIAAAEALDRHFVETYKHLFGFPDFDPFSGPSPDDNDHPA